MDNTLEYHSKKQKKCKKSDVWKNSDRIFSLDITDDCRVRKKNSLNWSKTICCCFKKQNTDNFSTDLNIVSFDTTDIYKNKNIINIYEENYEIV